MIKDQVKEEYPDLDLTIIDSRSASLGYGLSVIKAAEVLHAGGTKDEIVETARYHV